jgi:hypothetical protein
MGTRIFLAVSALLWLPYGLFCFVRPAFLAQAAGVSAATATGTIELQAMYGGLQAGIGALALTGALRVSWRRHALAALLFLCFGIGLARLVAAVGVGEVSAYTASALAFEWISAALALRLLRG